MPKITAVHVQTAPTKLDFIRQVNEEGFLDRIKQGIGALTGSKKPEASADEEPSRTAPPMDDDNDALATLTGELMTPPPSETRVVVYLEHALLKSMYLVAGGGSKLIEQLDDTEVTEIATDGPQTSGSTGKGRIVELNNGFAYDALITPPAAYSRADRGVMINVPKAVVAELRAAGADLPKAREALKKLMSHKLYVMTLNLTNANQRSIIAKMGTARNTDEMAKAFDPAIVENYPLKSRLVNAKNEWAAMKDASKRPSKDDRREAGVAGKEKEAGWATREREANAAIAGPAKDDVKEILQFVAAATTPHHAAETLQGMATRRNIPKDEMLAKLNTIKNAHPLVNMGEVIEKYRKMKQ